MEHPQAREFTLASLRWTLFELTWDYVLIMTVLAYAALIRDGSTTIYFNPLAQLGDLILGTGLIASAAVAIFDSAWRDHEIT